MLWTAVFLWYRGDPRSPLDAGDQQTFLAQITSLEAQTNGFLDAERMERFLANDDGQPFYVVNLFKLRDQAHYADGRPTQATGAEALSAFSRAVLPLWASKGTHPVFASGARPATRPALDDDGWDAVTVVRYRSRRDYAEIITSDAFLAALPHRLAAAEENLRVQLPGRLLPSPVLSLLLVCAVVVLTVHALTRRPRKRADRRQSG